MIVAAGYLLAHGIAAIVGLPILWLPPVRGWTALARVACSFAVGAVALAVLSTSFTLLGLRWSPILVLAPSVAAAIVLRLRGKRTGPERRFRPGAAAGAIGIAAAVVSFGHLVLSLALARATSTDFLLFWGVKAVHFAKSRSVDPVLLTWPFFGHGQPFYPPLVPVLDAWSILASSLMPWRAAPLVTALWFAAACVLVLEILRHRVGDRDATLVTTFWMAALGGSLVASLSGANAEAPLLLYESAAAALLITESVEPGIPRRFLVGLFLAGAVLTKIEGTIGSAILIGGAILRDAGARRVRPREVAALALPPLVAGLLWLGFVRRFDVPTSYAAKGHLLELHIDRLSHVLRLSGRFLENGTLWLGWAIPLAILLFTGSRSCLSRAWPALAAAGGILLFLEFIYLHETRDQLFRIGWELPRCSQPSMSLLIVSAGFCASLSSTSEHG